MTAVRTPPARRLPAPVAALEQQPELMDAACRDADPELFFPDLGANARQKRTAVPSAKEICYACPAQTACLVLSLTRGELEGIWGGRTPRERRTLMRDTVALRRDVRHRIDALERGIRVPLRANDFLAVVHELTLRGWDTERLAHATGVGPDTVVRARARASLAAAVRDAMEPRNRSEPAAA
ncbi:WhiB family transcriptional regulator [Streptomyces sp. NPDC048527]|uniref:WhiB family transcriptional regulator n=1 Tax=Streptomyces sp. NPDC048527 TaxID=3365568 RepID=UPI00370F76D3